MNNINPSYGLDYCVFKLFDVFLWFSQKLVGILWNSSNVVFYFISNTHVQIRDICTILHASDRILETTGVKRFIHTHSYSVIILFGPKFKYKCRRNYLILRIHSADISEVLCLGTMGQMYAIYGTVEGTVRRCIAGLGFPLTITKGLHVPTILGIWLYIFF